MSETMIPPTAFPAGVLPPLPPDWTEHRAPGGELYYYHAATNQSTYIRPLTISSTNPFALSNAIIPGAATKKKKEKPLLKTSIPDTPWLRVKTTEGNIFYTHKERKESVWEVPEEIREQVVQLERQEKEKEEQEVAEKLKQDEEQQQQEKWPSVEEERLKEQKEIERIKRELENEASSGKRKASESVEERKPSKKKRTTDENEEDVGHESEEDWQRNIAEEMAQETEQTIVAVPESPSEDSKSSKLAFKIPDKVNLSIDEAKALFKTLLQEKNINPIHPWDKSLPLFISDPRYVLLPSLSARREAFDEYCRDTLRAERAAKAAAAKENFSATGDKDKDAYYQLLKEEVTSTRTSWTDFRRKWKKDRRFYGWAGEHEREKAFREWLKDLAKVKKKQAEKAERDFFQLLKEHKEIGSEDEWKNVKRSINTKDPRYDAVGSSSLREELFNVYIKTLSQTQTQALGVPGQGKSPNDSHAEELDANGRKQRALKEREEKVRREREGIDRQLDRTRVVFGREEGELEFGTLLTDAIREPTLSWEEALPLLSEHPSFLHCNISPSVQRSLFYKHIGHLREKYLKNLHTLFAAHAPKLNTRWVDVEPNARKTIARSLPASKLKLAPTDDSGDEDLDSDEEAMRKRRRRKDDQLEIEFDRWQRQRNTEARKSFDDMLEENAFLEFWGRMGKVGGEGIDGGVKVEDEEEEAGEGGGGKADMKKLAKQIDEDEFGRVLKNDARWNAFDHIPEERIKWLRNHMERLSAPKLSVHLPDKH